MPHKIINGKLVEYTLTPVQIAVRSKAMPKIRKKRLTANKPVTRAEFDALKAQVDVLIAAKAK